MHALSTDLEKRAPARENGVARYWKKLDGQDRPGSNSSTGAVISNRRGEIAQQAKECRAGAGWLLTSSPKEDVLVDATRREQILAAARLLGPEKFNRLVSSVGQVRTLGRLRYWQEDLIAKLPDAAGNAISGLSDFIATFEKAELMPEPPPVVTREEFFSRPNYWYYLGGAPIPDQWIAEAWEQLPDFRENVTYEFVREASKNGDLFCIQSSLEFLAAILPLTRMVEVYERVRNNSPHRESEFRPTFERVFGQRMSEFPASLSRGEVIGTLAAFGFDEATALELMGEKQSETTGPSYSGGEIPF
jgi:hypothetical protein